MKLLIDISHTHPVVNSNYLSYSSSGNDKLSASADLRCRVPQRSILGPLLFLLYINNMPQAVDCDLFLYVDDTCLLFQHKDLE